MNVKKTLKVGGIIVLGTIVSAVVYFKVRLYRVYNNISTVPQAVEDMKHPNVIFINTNDGEIKKSDEEYENDNELFQYSNGADDNNGSSGPVVFQSETFWDQLSGSLSLPGW